MLSIKDKNGTATGLLALLANGSVDTICKMFARNNRNRKLFDFSRTLHAVSSSSCSSSSITDSLCDCGTPICGPKPGGHLESVLSIHGQHLDGHKVEIRNEAILELIDSTMLLAQLLVFAVITNAESRIAKRPTFSEFQACFDLVNCDQNSQILWRMFRVQLQQPDGVRFYSISG